MNLLWNKNIQRFRTRFPQLAELLASSIDSFERQPTHCYEMQQAKDGSPIAFENGLPLHSKYNPQREAQQAVASFSEPPHRGNANKADASSKDVPPTCAVFFSFGLGYTPIVFAEKFPNVPMVIVEPDSTHLFEAFAALDWNDVLSHEEVVFAIEADASTVAAIINKYSSTSCKVFSVAAQTMHAEGYYASVTELLARQKQKAQINTNTLEKFSHLWLHNSCCNLHYLAELDGVEKYRDCTLLPFVILAAGPSLSFVLPHLAELKKRCIIVCVDTALHACLHAGVEPDFIFLVDPQYACALHLEFLSAPSSILVTESAAYPSVFRFNCKEKVLCSSLFPVGQYFEKRLGNKGKLGAGGSVTTTAWDFARLSGTKEIYLAGMDLGFPNKQTHIRGSQFEERSHRTAQRTASAEMDTVASLLGANPAVAKDYDGNPLLTDERMSLFAWWFEANCKEAEVSGIHTYTLTPQSLAIPGITSAPLDQLLSRNEREQERAQFFAAADSRHTIAAQQAATSQSTYKQVLASFETDLTNLIHLAKEGVFLCEEVFADRTRAQRAVTALSKIDSQIMCSASKDAAALVFPTERQLEKEAQNIIADKTLHSFYYSRLIYQKLCTAAEEYLITLNSIQN